VERTYWPGPEFSAKYAAGRPAEDLSMVRLYLTPTHQPTHLHTRAHSRTRELTRTLRGKRRAARREKEVARRRVGVWGCGHGVVGVCASVLDAVPLDRGAR